MTVIAKDEGDWLPEQCVEPEGARGWGWREEEEEEEEEEELDDAKTAEITAAELLQMYHHFHPNQSHPTEATCPPFVLPLPPTSPPPFLPPLH